MTRRDLAYAFAAVAIVVGGLGLAEWVAPTTYEAREVHRATTEYRDIPCEEDEVLWWVEDGVRECIPLDDVK